MAPMDLILPATRNLLAVYQCRTILERQQDLACHQGWLVDPGALPLVKVLSLLRGTFCASSSKEEKQ